MIVFAAIQAAEAVARAEQGIQGGALVFMLVCMAAVAALTIWCYSRILRTKEHFDPDGTGPGRPPVPGEAEGRAGA